MLLGFPGRINGSLIDEEANAKISTLQSEMVIETRSAKDC